MGTRGVKGEEQGWTSECGCLSGESFIPSCHGRYNFGVEKGWIVQMYVWVGTVPMVLAGHRRMYHFSMIRISLLNCWTHQALRDRNLIPILGTTSSRLLWEKLYSFTCKQKFNPNRPVPCVDNFGSPMIACEIGAFPECYVIKERVPNPKYTIQAACSNQYLHVGNHYEDEGEPQMFDGYQSEPEYSLWLHSYSNLTLRLCNTHSLFSNHTNNSIYYVGWNEIIFLNLDLWSMGIFIRFLTHPAFKSRKTEFSGLSNVSKAFPVVRQPRIGGA